MDTTWNLNLFDSPAISSNTRTPFSFSKNPETALEHRHTVGGPLNRAWNHLAVTQFGQSQSSGQCWLGQRVFQSQLD